MDNAKVLEEHKTKTREREEAKIKVSVQNLVGEMMDIVECGEEGVEICETFVDEILCNMFGVRPLTEEENVVKGLVIVTLTAMCETAMCETACLTWRTMFVMTFLLLVSFHSLSLQMQFCR